MKMVACTALFLLLCCATELQLTEGRYYDKRDWSYEVDSLEDSPCGSCGCARSSRGLGGRFKRADLDQSERHMFHISFPGPLTDDELNNYLPRRVKGYVERLMDECPKIYGG